MSAYKWLAFAFGVPLLAVLYAIVMEFVLPTLEIANKFSSTPESAQGLEWYGQFMTWLPLVILILLAFMVVVAVITRRSRVVR